eukprot:3205763-Amphidinium_carterae.1
MQANVEKELTAFAAFTAEKLKAVSARLLTDYNAILIEKVAAAEGTVPSERRSSVDGQLPTFRATAQEEPFVDGILGRP